jgi:RNA polymerase sigma-70 factor (ECF subfamily)
VEEAALEKERRQRLQRAIEGLSPQQRQCLYLRAEGLRYAEIAQSLGIAVSTVAEFVSRATARLRKEVA